MKILIKVFSGKSLQHSGPKSQLLYSVTHQHLNKFSSVFWDNQWFSRNQIYLKLKLEKNLNLNLKFCLNLFLNFKEKWQKKIVL
jgi:hypothetical protein